MCEDIGLLTTQIESSLWRTFWNFFFSVNFKPGNFHRFTYTVYGPVYV